MENTMPYTNELPNPSISTTLMSETSSYNYLQPPISLPYPTTLPSLVPSVKSEYYHEEDLSPFGVGYAAVSGMGTIENSTIETSEEEKRKSSTSLPDQEMSNSRSETQGHIAPPLPASGKSGWIPPQINSNAFRLAPTNMESIQGRPPRGRKKALTTEQRRYATKMRMKKSDISHTPRFYSSNTYSTSDHDMEVTEAREHTQATTSGSSTGWEALTNEPEGFKDNYAVIGDEEKNCDDWTYYMDEENNVVEMSDRFHRIGGRALGSHLGPEALNTAHDMRTILSDKKRSRSASPDQVVETKISLRDRKGSDNLLDIQYNGVTPLNYHHYSAQDRQQPQDTIGRHADRFSNCSLGQVSQADTSVFPVQPAQDHDNIMSGYNIPARAR
jgi:hypothetical protein